MVICYDKITYEALRMDFQPQIKYILPMDAPMPFFMAYPDFPCLSKRAEDKEDSEEKEAKMFQDFEYLRKTYPTRIARYQKRVEEILDTMDYDGSMIYDEFPDRLSLLDLGNAVAKILAGMDGPVPGRGTLPSGEAGAAESGKAPGKGLGDMEEVYLQGLAQVLVCNEIYRRRNRGKEML